MKKTGSSSQAVKASIAFFFGSIVTKGISYLTTPIFTRMLTTEQYGQFSVYLTWQNLFGIVAMFCLSYGIFNNGMIDYEDKRDEFSFSMLILSNLITLVSLGAFVLLYPYISSFVQIEPKYIALMFGLFLVQPAHSFWNARQRYELKYKWNTLWTILISLISPIVAIVCIQAFGSDNVLQSRIFGAEIPLIVIYTGFYLYLGNRSHWHLNRDFWKQAFLFNLPLIPHYLSIYLLNSSDRIIIENLVNDTAVAYYSVACSISAMVMILWSAINGSLIPFTYEKCKVKDYAAIERITYPIMLLFGALCVCIGMFAPEVLKFMAREDYNEAVYVIPPLIGGIFFQVQYHLYANIVYYYKKPKYVMFGSVTAVVANIGLNYLFIPAYGYAAAGYTTLFCYAVQALIDYIAMREVVSERVYNGKFILLLSLGVVVLMLLTIPLYDKSPVIRYCILLCIVITGILNRSKLIRLLKEIRNKGEA